MLPEIASIVTIADFSERMISRLMKKRKKAKQTKPRPRRRKQTKEQELITKLLTNPEQAIKEMGAEYVVKNRKRIIKKIENYMVDQLE